MYPDYQQWVITSDRLRAVYSVKENAEGGIEVSVSLTRVGDGDQLQVLNCDLNTLRSVVERAQELKEVVEYKPLESLRDPVEVESLSKHEAKFFARLKDKNEEQLVVLFEENIPGDNNQKPQKFLCGLAQLEKFLNAGREYEQTLEQSRKWNALVRIVEPGPTRDQAVAQVVEMCTPRTAEIPRGIMTPEEGQLYASKHKDIFFISEEMSYVQKGRTIILSKTGDLAVDNRIDYVHFDQERRDENFVVGRWALSSPPPTVGEKVVWGGLPMAYNGEPLDYLVDYKGTTDGRGVPETAPYIVIRKGGADSPSAQGEVVAVCESRAEAVETRARASERLKEQHKMLTTDWAKHEFKMSRRDFKI